MRSLLFILVFYSFTTSFGQSHQMFPTDGFNYWWQEYTHLGDPWQPPSSYHIDYTVETTDSINGEMYYMLNNDGTTVGHYRVDSLLVYYTTDYVPSGNASLSDWEQCAPGEQLLYDYTLTIGDTFQIISGHEIVLEYFDSLLIDGNYHRTFHFSTPQDWYLAVDYYWIQGIGSSLGFFPYFDFFEQRMDFHCFFGDFLTYCPTAEIKKIDRQFSFYPNPVVDYLVIENEQGISVKGKLVNMAGQQLDQFSFSESKHQVNVEGIASGIYQLVLNDSVHLLMIE